MSEVIELHPGRVSPRDAAAVVARAREVQAAWSAVAPSERAKCFDRLADLVRDGADALVDLVHGENGKPRAEAASHEVLAALDAARWLAAHGPTILAPERVRVRLLPHRRVDVSHVPYGAVLVIGPWNLPLSIPFGQVAFAVMAGNAVVLKPSEYTPKCGAAIRDLFVAAGFPTDLVQVVAGDGAVGAALIAARPDKVAFTGSVATGRRVMATASAFPIPVTLELGGVDAMIVCADADLETATSAALWGATFNGGQVCCSVERILVEEPIAERFVGRLLQKVERIDPQRDLGRLTVPRQAAVYERHVADARARGLRILCGGVAEGDRWLPTFVVGEGITEAAVWSEETFGPIAAIATFRGDDEAVRLHDATAFGLTASVYTADPARAERLASRLRAGAVSVNDVAALLHAFAAVPWGGVAESGFGRSHGRDGLLDFTWTRTVDRPRRLFGRDVGAGIKAPWGYPYDPDHERTMRALLDLAGARGVRRGLHAARSVARAAADMFTRTPRI
jgi:succinate-semialdehyde dehydrogenase/glutarate-semialdehyde dehydrogenase